MIVWNPWDILDDVAKNKNELRKLNPESKLLKYVELCGLTKGESDGDIEQLTCFFHRDFGKRFGDGNEKLTFKIKGPSIQDYLKNYDKALIEEIESLRAN